MPAAPVVRAAVAAPGSGAARPRHIPARGWRLVLRRVGRRALADRLPLLSAGVAFFALLSIAPVLLTAVSVYGVVTTPTEATRELSDLAGVLPPELEAVVADQLTATTAASAEVLTVRGLVGLLLALWTATAATSSLLEALDLAYHEDETRSFVRRTAVALAFVLGGAVLLGAVVTVAGAAASALEGAPGAARGAAQGLGWLALAVLAAVVLAVLYRFGPDRTQPRWCWTSWGATGATALWLLTTAGLFAYAQHLGSYSATYGSLAGVALSMLWLWLTVLLVVLGAAVNAESERQTARDSTVGPEQPPGQRGAVVADSTPPYPGEG